MGLRAHLDDLLELRHQARTLGLASHHLVNSSFSGLYASVFRGQGLNFEEVREYRQGDDIRNMDWKVTARTGDAHLKVFREERERAVMLCVDQSPHMQFGTRNTFKEVRAAQAAALLGWAANGLHDRVGGLLFGDPAEGSQYFRPTKDRRALWRLLKALSSTSEAEVATPPELLADVLTRADRGVGTGGLIFVIADFDRELPGLRRSLTQLRQRHSVVLIPVDDPADKELPPMGEVLFRGPDGELIEVDTDNPSGREAYRTAWENRRGALTNLANQLGIAVIPVSTNQDAHRSLMRGLEQRARMRHFL